MPLINCKIESNLRWSKHCILSVGGTDNVNGNNNDININKISTRDNQEL